MDQPPRRVRWFLGRLTFWLRLYRGLTAVVASLGRTYDDLIRTIVEGAVGRYPALRDAAIPT
jgi:hypothetical protein